MFRILLVTVMVSVLVACSGSSGKKVDANNFEQLIGGKFFACNELRFADSKEVLPLVSDNGQDIYLRFKNGGFSGRAPINLFFGAMKISDGETKFGDIGATMKSGSEELMAAEQKFFAALNSVNTMKYDEKKAKIFLIKDKNVLLECSQTSEEEMKTKITEALENRANEVFGTEEASKTTTTATPVVAK